MVPKVSKQSGGNVVALANITYVPTINFNGNVTVAYGASGILGGSVSLATSGVSSVSINSIALGAPTQYYTISTQALPTTLVTNQSAYFNVIYNNTRLHGFEETSTFAVDICSNAMSLSADFPHTLVTPDPYLFGTATFTLTALSQAPDFKRWDSLATHSRKYVQGDY